MAASTGPDVNTYQIPEVQLGDNFAVWRDLSNTHRYKLNKMEVYKGISSSSISMTTDAGGTLQAELADNVGKGVTFLNPVVFSSGVTFNGDVTFNASTFTVNANVVTIDDYAVVLGDTAAASDTNINTAGGGGIYLKRGSGVTAEWIWKPNFVYGVTGVWQSNAHIGFSGATFGIYPNLGATLPVHGTGILLDGGATGQHGLLVNLTSSSGVGGLTSDRVVQFVRYSPSGSTAFMEVLSGTTYGNRPFVNISDGANRKVVTTASSHGFAFGNPVRFDGTNYAQALATDGANAEVIGIVSKVINSTTFELTFIGEIFGDFTSVNGGSALNPGSTYYLSPYTSGAITSVQPTASGSVHKAVFIATSATSAVVIPFTGGVLSSPLNLANSSSVATRIQQANKFSIGDILRFKAYNPGVTLEYIYNSSGNTYGEYHDHGIYVKAQANSAEEAEVAGMVIGFAGTTGDTGYETYTGFDILMDGFFDVSSSSISLSPGSVYYLNQTCAGTTGSFESAALSYSTSAPTVVGRVRKPMLMATAPKAGYLFSYRGDIRAETAIEGSSADVSRLLVSDIRDGFSGDLKIGVYNGSSNGLESIRIAAGSVAFNETRGATRGYVGIGRGWSQWNSGTDTQNRIMTELDVEGVLRLGKTLAATPQGQDLLVVRNTGDAVSGVTVESRIVMGTDYSNANLVLGRGVRPARGAAGYISSLAGSQERAALVIGVSGADGSVLRWGRTNSTAALGVAVALTDVFSIVGTTAAFIGSLGVTGGELTLTPSAGGRVAAVINGETRFYPNTTTTTVGLRVYEDPDTAGYLRFRAASASQNGFVFSGDNDSATLTVDSLNDRVGIRNASPAVALDITGEARSSTSTTSASNANTLTTKDYVDSNIAWYNNYPSQNKSTNPPIGTIVIAAINLAFAAQQAGQSNTGNTSPGAIGSTIAATSLKVNANGRYGFGASHPYGTTVSGTWKVVCYMDEDGGTTDQAWVMLVRTA